MKNIFPIFKKKKEWKDIQVSIIVSTGRTGTKFFCNLLMDENNYLSVHEPDPIGNHEGFEFLKGKLHQYDLINFLIKGRKSQLNIINKKNYSNYLESNGGLIFYVQFLKQVFPNLRVAHIIRDPRDFIRSGCSRVVKSSDSTFPKIKYEIDENWPIKSNEILNDEYKNSLEWSSMTMPERFMWIWNLKNKYVHDASLKHSYIRIFKFENIFSNSSDKEDFLRYITYDSDIEHLFNKYNFLSKVNNTPKYLFPHYNDWSNALKEKLNHHCGTLMKIYNYSY